MMNDNLDNSPARHSQSGDRKTTVSGHMVFFLSLVCVFSSSALFAGPEADTKKGMEAFLEGDTVGAMRLYRKAAEQGYAPAQEKLAYILDQSEFNEEAIEWFRKAADQNNAEGQYGLGMMYLIGDGIEKDPAKALQLIEAAAQQGLLRAMMSMFHFSRNGDHGLAVNLQQAVSWLEKIALLDNQWAIEKLARAWRKGELGLAVDNEKAGYWEDKLRNRGR